MRTTPTSVRATNSNLIISFQVLDKRHDASNARKSSFLERAKRAPGEGITLISKRIKAIKLSDKSEFRWQVMVNEHPSDNDEKKMSRAKRKAVKDRLRWQQRARSSRKPSRSAAKHFDMICRILQSFCV